MTRASLGQVLFLTLQVTTDIQRVDILGGRSTRGRAPSEYMREGDMLTVHEVDRLGRSLLEGLVVPTDLFERGIAVKVLDGIAQGEHIERSQILDLALALAEDPRRDIVRKTKHGLDAARARGKVGGRPRVVDQDKRAAILARRVKGQSIREIASAVGVSVGTVSGVLKDDAEKAGRG